VLTVEALEGDGPLSTLEQEWEALAQDGPPFTRPAWFRCCGEGYGEHRQRLTLTVREHGRLLAVAPLWRSTLRERGLPCRRLEFVSSPDSPRVDLVVDPQRRQQTLDALIRHVLRERRDWDVTELARWPSDSPNLEASRRLLARAGGRFLVARSSLIPYVVVEGGWEGFLRTRSQKFRKTARNVANRVQRLGGVEVCLYESDPDGRILDEFVALSERSWKYERGVALASREGASRFFRALTPVAGQRGWLLAWVLRKDGRAIATEYALRHDGTVYALRADFDQDFHEYSPGAYLQNRILEHVFDGGYREYNSGPGASAYKLHAADWTHENLVLRLFNRTPVGHALWILEGRVLPFLRRARRRVGREV